MSVTSRPRWQQALRRVEGLPPCPPDWSEPFYANLAFSMHCHVCIFSFLNDFSDKKQGVLRAMYARRNHRLGPSGTVLSTVLSSGVSLMSTF